MIIDHIRNLDEFKKLFIERPMNQDVYSFDFIVNNPHTYCFYTDDKLKAFIFIAKHGKRLFLSGASRPKMMEENIAAINAVCGAYDEPIYSDTDIKAARLVLLKAGFKRLRNTNIYKRSKLNVKKQ